MEAFRALGLLAERPDASHRWAVEALGLGPGPEATLDVLPPYASIYLGADGQIGGEARDRIAGFWRALGLTPPHEPDHLAVLLAGYAALGEAERAESTPARHEAWGRARRTFLCEHLMSWLPPYLDAVAALGIPFYARWAALLSELLVAEGHPSERLPRHLAAAPPLSADLEGLGAPARSGIILPRGRRLSLDVLTAEAEVWVARHRRRPHDPTSAHWAERAEATRALLAQRRSHAGACQPGR